MRGLVVLIFTTSLFIGVFTAPLTENEVSKDKTKSIKTHTDAFKFLVTLGYNPCAGKMISFCRRSLESMLESYQTTYSLPVTKKLDAATLKLMNSPKVTGSNSKTIPPYNDKYSLWPTNRMLTWRLEAGNLFSDRESIGEDIQQTFDNWAQHCQLTFREATEDETADFNLAFVSGKRNGTFLMSDGPGSQLGYAFSPRGELRGVIHFDSAENWSQEYNDDSSSFNFRLVATHIIGHSLGLEHSSNKNSIMHATYHVPESIDILSSEDIAAIQALYGKPNKKEM